jgi:hypothetical protein
MQIHEIALLLIASTAAIYGYIRYGREIPKKTLRPRPFSWLIWGVLSTCVSIIQIQNGAELGVIGTLLGAASGYILAGMSWYYGHRKIYTLDVVSLLLAFGVLLLWAFVGDEVTVIAATAVYMIGFAPTIARAWKAPHKERRTTFAMSVLKYSISFLLLDTVTLATAAYPVALALVNLGFIVMLAVRRKQSKKRI